MGNLPLGRDWDILILLDACRYDYFERLNPYKGKLEPYDIGCNGTKKYFQMNFSSNCTDVVFINHIILFDEWIKNDTFHKVIHAHEMVWNEEYGTVLPEDNTKLAIEAIKKYPNKRVIIHYAQPHIPFLDREPKIVKQKTHKQVVYKNGMTDFIMKKMNICKNLFPPMPFWYIEKTFGESAGIGEIYFKEGFSGMKKSYEYNLKRVLDSISSIIDLGKKTVITSDHGKIIGEYHMFSHGWYKSKYVTRVPWFEVENGSD